MRTTASTRAKGSRKRRGSGKIFKKGSNRAVDLTDREFERLTAKYDTGRRDNKKIVWFCECKCGNTTEVRSSHLLGGRVVSCGCFKQEDAVRRAAAGKGVVKRTHGKSGSQIYAVHRAMLQRCYDETSDSFARYGERGITVCQRWRGRGGFARFLVDMGEPPFAGASVERKKNNRGYSKANCVWATRKQQARNRRGSRFVEFEGRRILLIELAEEKGIAYKLLHQRYVMKGWTLHDALVRPNGSHTEVIP